MSAITGFSNVYPRPSVPRPKLDRRQNLSTTVVKEAFHDEYWLQRTGNWAEKVPIQNVLTLMQEICEEVFNEYQEKMDSRFTFIKQNTIIKDAMYAEFLNLLKSNGMKEEERTLILEMLEATDPRDKDDFRGRRWLFEYCMRRTWENRNSRAKAKDPQTKKRHRGTAYFYSESSSQQSQHAE
ncbi:hypothetical protein TWF281_007837 [Arthrobotrys megalospora]